MRKLIGAVIALLCVIVIVLGIGVFQVNSDKISKNVYVKEINIGGLTKEEAIKKLNDEYILDTFDFNFQDKKWSINPDKIDVNYNIEKTAENAYKVNRNSNIIANSFNSLKSMLGSKNEITVEVNLNEEKLKSELQAISDEINVEVKDASLKTKDKQVVLVEEVTGLELDIESSADNFIKNIQSGSFSEELVVTKIEPELSSEDLKNVDTLLGSYSTILYNNSYPRVENIKLAAKRTSNILLMPGEEFSYNEHTKSRSRKNGYKSAPVISGGEVIEGVGGGVCQVSSTLFNSVLYSDLEIISRTNHSIPSDYTDLGRDAMVNDSGTDFVFKNNHKNPVFIKNTYSNGRIKSEIYGFKSDKKNIKIKYSIDSATPPRVVQKNDSSLASGKQKTLQRGRSTYIVSTYRVYYDSNGKKIKSEKVCKSYYPGREKIVLVGTKSVAKKDTSSNDENNNSSNKKPIIDDNNSGSGQENTSQENTNQGDTSGETSQE